MHEHALYLAQFQRSGEAGNTDTVSEYFVLQCDLCRSLLLVVEDSSCLCLEPDLDGAVCRHIPR